MTRSGFAYWLFGTLSLSDFPPKSDTIATVAAMLVVVGGIALAVLLTWTRRWTWLWRDWLTSLDHKKIGIMYVAIAFVMLARALIEAALMRTQQALAVNAPGVVGADHFAELFTTHGSVMIFFVAMPFLTGIINFAMPFQIGARDLQFPFLNAIALWLTAAGAAILMASLVVGKFATGGWSGYPPYNELAFSPGEGVDYWIWAVTLSSIGSTLAGINIAVTLYKSRTTGMALMLMPLFCWAALCTAILMIFAMPALTVATGLLALDRYAGFHFFTNAAGGNMMNYANLFWLFGHPEVYILILPAFGVWSEVISTFSGKRLYGYRSLVWATMAIAVLSFTVWLHHFFTMGQSANINAAFGIATMLIAIPTGVKVYAWLWTMFRGRLRATAPMLFAATFIACFVIGGLSGVILANPSVDYQVHNSLFLVAHFHNMLIPGTLFGMIAAYMFWFPKAYGFRLDERWGRIAWGLWSAGFLVAFVPLYALGLMGAMRRSASFIDPTYRPWLQIAWAGAGLIVLGFVALVVQLWTSIRHRDALAVPAGDPWDGHSLDWWGPAPAPEWNFPDVPEVTDTEAFTVMKRDGSAWQRPATYHAIAMPRPSGLPFIIGVAGFLAAFGLTWHIWWEAVIGVIAIWGAVIWRSCQTDTTRVVPANEVQAQWDAFLALVERTAPVGRERESTPSNRGLAEHQA